MRDRPCKCNPASRPRRFRTLVDFTADDIAATQTLVFAHEGWIGERPYGHPATLEAWADVLAALGYQRVTVLAAEAATRTAPIDYAL